MAKNLSERLLDMVEDDPRFIGLTASQTLAWLKIIRLIDRNYRKSPGLGTSWEEVRFRLHFSEDRLLTLLDVLHARGLLSYSLGSFGLPIEVLRIIDNRPAEKRAVERFRQIEVAVDW